MRELRVHGPPGTGKTTYLKRRVEATARERGAHSIRIASLTRAAAAEIASRVDLPRENVGTLHAHAYRALDQPELAETPQGRRAWNERASRIAQEFVLPDRGSDVTLDDAGGEALVPKTIGESLLQQYGVLRARCMPAEVWPDRVRAFAEHWEAFKRATKRLDFSDLIEEATREFPYMPGSPQVFLLDEAQDMSRLEMLLARQWGEACEVFVVVGDPFQNLYQWRGSDPEVFDDAHGGEVHVLDQSYRVPRAVHSYSVRWLEQELPGGLTVEYKPRDADGKVRRLGETYRSPEGLAQQLERDLDGERRVMVLAATGYMLEPLVAILKRRGVPFGNPYKEKHGGWNPLAGTNRLLALLRPDREVWGERARAWQWRDVLAWSDPLTAAEVFHRGAKSFIESKCLSSTRSGVTDEHVPGSEPAESLLELVKPEHHDFVTAFALGLGVTAAEALDWYEPLLRKSRAGQLAYGLNVARRHGGRALRGAPGAVSHGHERWPGIVIGTIHSVKGGEADTVYVFPDVSNAGFDGWLMPGSRHDAIARQMYVAFTRARDELVLCLPSSNLTVWFP